MKPKKVQTKYLFLIHTIVKNHFFRDLNKLKDLHSNMISNNKQSLLK